MMIGWRDATPEELGKYPRATADGQSGGPDDDGSEWFTVHSDPPGGIIIGRSGTCAPQAWLAGGERELHDAWHELTGLDLPQKAGGVTPAPQPPSARGSAGLSREWTPR